MLAYLLIKTWNIVNVFVVYTLKYVYLYYLNHSLPSVLWCCWLGSRKGIRPVKTECWGAGVVICLEQGADLPMAQLMPLPLTVSCFSKIRIGFTFLIPAHPGSPGKRAGVCVWKLQRHVYIILSSQRWRHSVAMTSLLLQTESAEGLRVTEGVRMSKARSLHSD